jgi:hypothetical protein
MQKLNKKIPKYSLMFQGKNNVISYVFLTFRFVTTDGWKIFSGNGLTLMCFIINFFVAFFVFFNI